MQQLTTIIGFLYVSVSVSAFTQTPLLNTKPIASYKSTTECKAEATSNNVLDSFVSMINGNGNDNNTKKYLMAQSLVLSLINDDAITTPHPCLTDQNPYPIPYERHTMRIWWWDIAESDIYPQNYFTTTLKFDRFVNKSGCRAV